jgi:hypothetical protein
MQDAFHLTQLYLSCKLLYLNIYVLCQAYLGTDGSLYGALSDYSLCSFLLVAD